MINENENGNENLKTICCSTKMKTLKIIIITCKSTKTSQKYQNRLHNDIIMSKIMCLIKLFFIRLNYYSGV